jgi:hypothetical protein
MKCDGCEAEMTYEVVELDVIVAGRHRQVGQPGWYCWACRISTHSASDLYLAEQALPASLRRRAGQAGATKKNASPNRT